MPDGFKLVMAGSINDGIGIPDLISFLEELRDYNDIKIIFIGGGSKKDYLEEYVKKQKLKNVFLLGMFPYEMMPSFYAKADAMLLTLAQRKEVHLDVTIPSRLQSYLSAGKPVFAMIGSGARQVIEEANCGFVAPSGDYRALAKLVINNYLNKPLLQELGDNSRKVFLKQFTIEVGVEHFKKLING